MSPSRPFSHVPIHNSPPSLPVVRSMHLSRECRSSLTFGDAR